MNVGIERKESMNSNERGVHVHGTQDVGGERKSKRN